MSAIFLIPPHAVFHPSSFPSRLALMNVSFLLTRLHRFVVAYACLLLSVLQSPESLFCFLARFSRVSSFGSASMGCGVLNTQHAHPRTHQHCVRHTDAQPPARNHVRAYCDVAPVAERRHAAIHLRRTEWIQRTGGEQQVPRVGPLHAAMESAEQRRHAATATMQTYSHGRSAPAASLPLRRSACAATSMCARCARTVAAAAVSVASLTRRRRRAAMEWRRLLLPPRPTAVGSDSACVSVRVFHSFIFYFSLCACAAPRHVVSTSLFFSFCRPLLAATVMAAAASASSSSSSCANRTEEDRKGRIICVQMHLFGGLSCAELGYLF